MSPVGDKLRSRCRNFPGLVNNTVIDWFEPWPEQVRQGGLTGLTGAGGCAVRCMGCCFEPRMPLTAGCGAGHSLPASVPSSPPGTCHAWCHCLPPPQALHSVATAFLGGEDLPAELLPAIVGHMVGVHQSVRAFSTRFAEQLRRHNYVTVGGVGGVGGWVPRGGGGGKRVHGPPL